MFQTGHLRADDDIHLRAKLQDTLRREAAHDSKSLFSVYSNTGPSTEDSPKSIVSSQNSTSLMEMTAEAGPRDGWSPPPLEEDLSVRSLRRSAAPSLAPGVSSLANAVAQSNQALLRVPDAFDDVPHSPGEETRNYKPRASSHDSESSIEGPSTTSDVRDGVPLRRGRWTEEEEAYAMCVIRHFERGVLSAATGTSLRNLLAEKLHCDPMRITKKFAGDSSVGKRVYHPCPKPRGDMDGEAARAQAELEAHERSFFGKVKKPSTSARSKHGASSTNATTTSANSRSAGGGSAFASLAGAGQGGAGTFALTASSKFAPSAHSSPATPSTRLSAKNSPSSSSSSSSSSSTHHFSASSKSGGSNGFALVLAASSGGWADAHAGSQGAAAWHRCAGFESGQKRRRMSWRGTFAATDPGPSEGVGAGLSGASSTPSALAQQEHRHPPHRDSSPSYGRDDESDRGDAAVEHSGGNMDSSAGAYDAVGAGLLLDFVHGAAREAFASSPQQSSAASAPLSSDSSDSSASAGEAE